MVTLLRFINTKVSYGKWDRFKYQKSCDGRDELAALPENQIAPFSYVKVKAVVKTEKE